jgi:2-hydroxychromene-2-carboxylate isomerase
MTDSTVERPASIDFYFDIMCPYAYQSSKWVRDVRDQADVEVVWRFFSLEEINHVDGKKHPWEREWSYGWSQMRIAAWLRRPRAGETGGDGAGNERVDRWYAGVGRAFHEDGRRPHRPEVQRELLGELGLGGDALDAALADPTTHEEVRADHEHVVSTYGAFGVPTIVFPDPRPDAAADDTVAIYQQLVPAPPRDEAVALFDVLCAYNRFPTMFEMRHPKRPSDIRLVAETFEPYLTARAWKTIENEAP